MELSRLLLLAILLPSAFVVGVSFLSYVPHQAGLFSHRDEHAVLSAVMVAGIIPFSLFMLHVFRRIQGHILAQNEELARRNKEMEALLRLGRALEQSLDLDEVLPAALDTGLQATSADAAEVWLLDVQQGVVALRHHRGADRDAFLEITRFALGEGYPGIVAQTGKSILVHDLPKDSRFLRQRVKAQGFQTFYAMPLRRGNSVLGVLAVAAKDPGALTEEAELRLLELMAERIATAVENAQLHEKIGALAIVTERERLAREMHDGLAQVLGYVNTKAQAVKELLKTGELDNAIQQMGQLEAAAQETYDDVREAILALGSNEMKRPLLESLKEYVRRFSELSDLKAEFVVQGPPRYFDPGEEVQLLRIVQEALANVRKHAQASHVQVSLFFYNGGCRLVIEDNGRGFDKAHLARGPWPHLGLQSMQERAAAVNAQLDVDTAPGEGTRVIVYLPRMTT